MSLYNQIDQSSTVWKIASIFFISSLLPYSKSPSAGKEKKQKKATVWDNAGTAKEAATLDYSRSDVNGVQNEPEEDDITAKSVSRFTSDFEQK